MGSVLKSLVPERIVERIREGAATSGGAALGHEVAALVARGSVEDLLAKLDALEPADDLATRAAFLEVGRALLRTHRRPDLASKAFLQAYECDMIAKYEFGETILTHLQKGRHRYRDVAALIEPLCEHPDAPLAPDLAEAVLRYLISEPRSDKVESMMMLSAEQVDADRLSELAADAQEMDAYWAESLLMKCFVERPGVELHGMGPYLRLGRALLKQGRLGEAAKAFVAGQKANPEAKLHFGSYLVEFLSAGRPDVKQVGDFVEVMEALESEDVLVQDARRELLEYVLGQPPSDARTAVADRLVRGAPIDMLIKMGDRSLGEGRNQIAVQAYEYAIRRQPNDILLRLQLGITEFLDNNHRRAIAHFNVLGSLQVAEQDRWGVRDSSVRVMHWTWTQAFGHITLLDTYIKALKLGWLPEKRSVLAFDRTNPPAGWRLLQYFSKYLETVGVVGDPAPVLDSIVFGDGPLEAAKVARAGLSDTVLTPLSDSQRDLRRLALTRFYWTLPTREGGMTYISDYSSDVQRAWKEQGRGPLLSLEEGERERFRAVMEEAFGLPQDAWFVLLHVREPSFKPGWDKRHAYTRNAPIADYDDAIDAIVEQGGWVIRGGDPSMRRLRPRDRVIDYATSPFRSPELDIQLCSECHFFLGTNSGFSLTPPLFGKRCVLTNWSPLANPNWYPDDIFVPKLVRERATGRFLTLEEMYASKAGWSQFQRDFMDKWEKLDNDPADIVKAVNEMLAKLDGSWKENKGDEERQQEYEQIVQRYRGYLGSRLGDTFLRENAWLLNNTPSSSKVAE